MSVAAQSCLALDAELAAALARAACAEQRRAAVRGLGRSFQKRLATVIAPAWMMAAAEDIRQAHGVIQSWSAFSVTGRLAGLLAGA